LFLARAASDRGLVALRLTKAGGDQEFQLEAVRQLGSRCRLPRGPPAVRRRFVAGPVRSKCGSAPFGDAGKPESPHAREELRAAVDEAAAGRYEIWARCAMPRGPGGLLRPGPRQRAHRSPPVQPEGAEEFSIGKTNVMRRLSVSIQSARGPGPRAPPAPIGPRPSSAAAPRPGGHPDPPCAHGPSARRQVPARPRPRRVESHPSRARPAGLPPGVGADRRGRADPDPRRADLGPRRATVATFVFTRLLGRTGRRSGTSDG
jgi:hypothetical protein